MAKGIWLRQSSAAAAIGCGISKFGSSYKGKLKFKMEDGHKLYFVPLELMREEYQSTYQDKIIEVAGDEAIDDLLTELNIAADFDNSLSAVDIQEARRKKIIKETEYLDQKIKERKQVLFSEWSERFFIVFERSFTKFKNSLIDLHLDKEAVSKLTENLNLALNAMQESLDNISAEYMNEVNEEQIEDEE
mgnify:CR=1 FL=1